MDRQTFADIEEYGLEKWLGELTKELKDKTYQAQSGPEGMDPKGGWRTAAVGHTDDPRPRGANGGSARARTDLRGGPAARATRLPT